MLRHVWFYYRIFTNLWILTQGRQNLCILQRWYHGCWSEVLVSKFKSNIAPKSPRNGTFTAKSIGHHWPVISWRRNMMYLYVRILTVILAPWDSFYKQKLVVITARISNAFNFKYRYQISDVLTHTDFSLTQKHHSSNIRGTCGVMCVYAIVHILLRYIFCDFPVNTWLSIVAFGVWYLGAPLSWEACIWEIPGMNVRYLSLGKPIEQQQSQSFCRAL